MKILITNDDSINSPGLWELVKLSKKYGEIKVIAPTYEQSGKSHGINIHDHLHLKKIENEELECYSLNSTPADCVRAAYFGFGWDFDIVFSGINRGLNIGEDIFYSGTCAAATEAAMLGKMGIAFSTVTNSFDTFVSEFDSVMDFILSKDLLKKGSLYNINVPQEVKGIKFTFQGQNHYDTRFIFEKDHFIQRGTHHYEKEKENINSDVWAIYNNYISVTPLNFDRTDYELFEKLVK
ncbi:MAG TPA: 5'/3'-nucleotidase SurE [Acholeplasmataceae bacterium]|jgi:5'-nucleotidase|nr:5'/3'-nucleotidase SurE [Acholeplasmataceae bacterium]